MWNFIDSISQDKLDAWFRGFTILAISLPILGAILGGVCGWGAFIVSTRIGDLQAADLQKAQAETAHIREQLAGRDFTQDQHDRLVSVVKGLPHSVTSKVIFDSAVGNLDAKRYGGLIAKALSDALGVPIDEPLGLSTCVECTGVWVCVNESATAKTAEDGKVIRQAFELAGVTGAKFCTDPRDGQGTSDTVKVIVGPKQ